MKGFAIGATVPAVGQLAILGAIRLILWATRPDHPCVHCQAWAPLVLLLWGEELFVLTCLGLVLAALVMRKWWLAAGVAMWPIGLLAWAAPAWLS
jgi:hypothetical protein